MDALPRTERDPQRNPRADLAALPLRPHGPEEASRQVGRKGQVQDAGAQGEQPPELEETA